MYTKPLVLCWLSLLLIGCTSLTPSVPPSTAQKPHPQYWLKTSLYGGNFYDDDSITLIDTRPFSAIADAAAGNGFTLYPPPANHTIPAGTLVEIIKVSYPEQDRLKRPLYSPKDNIWVYIKVAKERGLVSFFRPKMHILVVPKSYSSESQLKTYLASFLSTQNPNTWILQEPTSMQEAIWHKKPLIGMTPLQLEATLGQPLKKQYSKELNKDEQEEFWHYNDYFIVLKKGLTIKIKNLSQS